MKQLNNGITTETLLATRIANLEIEKAQIQVMAEEQIEKLTKEVARLQAELDKKD